jgi:hypothetical protein
VETGKSGAQGQHGLHSETLSPKTPKLQQTTHFPQTKQNKEKKRIHYLDPFHRIKLTTIVVPWLCGINSRLVPMYENGKMTYVETIPGIGRIKENDGPQKEKSRT